MSRRILFCWEIGEGTGHVRPYLSLLQALEDRGDRVALALRNTSAVDAAVRARFPVFQAPVCQNEFSGIAASPANHTELYLGVGFAHAGTLSALAGAWRALFEAWGADLVLANNAPVALLAAHGRGTPSVRVGTGFECPPGGARPPLLQPWRAGLEERLVQAEAFALRQANAALVEMGVAPVSRLSGILHEGPTVLATVPGLDPFHPRATGTAYAGLLPSCVAGEGAAPSAEIFAYLRLAHPRTRDLLATLRQCGRSCLAVVPDASEADCIALAGPSLELRNAAVALPDAFAGCSAFVGYGSHGTTLAALLAGVPVLLVPDHAEQRHTAKAVADAGAGLVLQAADKSSRALTCLKRLLEEPALAGGARRFAESHARLSGEAALDRALAAIETATPARPQLRVVAQ